MRFYLFWSGQRSQGPLVSEPTKRNRNRKQGNYQKLVNYAWYIAIKHQRWLNTVNPDGNLCQVLNRFYKLLAGTPAPCTIRVPIISFLDTRPRLLAYPPCSTPTSAADVAFTRNALIFLLPIVDCPLIYNFSSKLKTGLVTKDQHIAQLNYKQTAT